MNIVLARDGKLEDVFVRVANGAQLTAGALPPPAERVVFVSRVDCMYIPRIQGAFVDPRPGTTTVLHFQNTDRILHNVSMRMGNEHPFGGVSEPFRGPPIEKTVEELGLYIFRCDVHPWERSFLFATSHPYFAVTADDGTFTIDSVPPGTYEIEAWHSFYGWKRQAGVTVAPGGTATVDFGYSTATDHVPEENRDEDLTDLTFPSLDGE